MINDNNCSLLSVNEDDIEVLILIHRIAWRINFKDYRKDKSGIAFNNPR